MWVSKIILKIAYYICLDSFESLRVSVSVRGFKEFEEIVYVSFYVKANIDSSYLQIIGHFIIPWRYCYL